MAQQYAKDQPKGFTNRIENVAILGASGHIGGHITKELLATGKHTVTAITRQDSTSKFPEGVKVARVDLQDHVSLVAALKGQDFLVISLSFMSPKETQDNLLKAATEAGCRWVMPNAYSVDIANKSLSKDISAFPKINIGIEALEAAGPNDSRVVLISSLWYDFCLANAHGNLLGIDIANKKATFIDDAKTRINMSTLEQCGRAMGKFLSLKELPEDENDTAPTMSQWRNKPLYIASFLVSQREVLDSIHRVRGSTDADWQIEYQSSEERVKQGLELIQGSDFFTGISNLLGGRTFNANGDGNYEASKGLANEVLGLSKEDLDDATRRAIKAIESGEDLFKATP